MADKFALFEYNTENIGDEVQSIAARRFLPKVDYYIDRDNLSNFKSDHSVKLIMNGWYNRNPKSWPPRADSNIEPLLISMHVSQKDKQVVKSFLSPDSVEFLKKNGPVGARDKTTEEFFIKHNIPSYFSGCVTLTLQRDPEIKKRDFILAVDVSKKIVETIKQRTNRPVIEISVYHFPYLSREERFFVAEYFLSLYQSAAAVITTRLHAMLPSLAFETPVLLIKDNKKYEAKRYAGLMELVRSATEQEFINSSGIFKLDNPTKNPSKYKKIRESIIEKCSNFTGFNNDKTFRTIELSDGMFDVRFVRAFAFGWSSTFPKALLEGDVAWRDQQVEDLRTILDEERKKAKHVEESLRKEINKQTAYAKELNEQLNCLYSSKSWRYTAFFRSIMKLKSNK